MGLSGSDKDFVLDLCDEYDIPSDGVFISTSSSHLSHYNPVNADAETTGKFLGYPDDAVEFYTTSSDPAGDSDTFVAESTTITEAEVSEMSLIEYIPASTEDAYQRAKQEQRRYEQALRACSVDFSSVPYL